MEILDSIVDLLQWIVIIYLLILNKKYSNCLLMSASVSQ